MRQIVLVVGASIDFHIHERTRQLSEFELYVSVA